MYLTKTMTLDGFLFSWVEGFVITVLNNRKYMELRMETVMSREPNRARRP